MWQMTQPDRPGEHKAGIQAGAGRERWLPGLRAYLIAFAMALLLPALGIGGAVAWQAIQAYRGAFEGRLQDTARALALALDREIGAYEATLAGLAAAPELDEGAGEAALARFRARAHAIAAAMDSWVVVQGPGPDYAMLLHTLAPAAQPLGSGLRLPEPDAPVPRVFRTGRPAVGSLARGLRSGRQVAFVFAPVTRQGRVIRAIGMALDPVRIARLLERHNLPPTAFAVVTDQHDMVVARSRNHARYVGRAAPSWYAAGKVGRTSGFLTGQALEGQPVVLGFATLAAAPGWSIAVSEAAAAYEASWRRPMQALAVGAALALLLGLALALWLGGRLLRPVRALTADAATVTRPGATPPLRAVPMAVAEFETLRRHLGAADATLRLQAAEARAGEARLRTAQAVGQLGVFEYDVARDRFWRSEEQQRLHGLDAGAPQPDLAGYLAQVHPQDRPGFARKIEAAFLGREGVSTVHHVFRFHRFDTGAERWLAVDAEVTERDRATGRALRVNGTTRDITEHQRAVLALAASEERLRLAIEGTGMGSWDLDIASGRLIFSRHVFLMLGRTPPPGGETTLEAWRTHVHPEDLPVLRGAWRQAEQEGSLYHATYRIRRANDGMERWMESYGRFIHAAGATGPRFVGVMFDVTARRQTEERQGLLMREVDHRAKNVLAVVLSVVRLSRNDDPRAFAEAVEGRVAALARTHELLAREKWSGATLRALAEEELAAYRGAAAGRERILLDGPPLRLEASAVQPLSMALHELATNAARHGSLSRPEGQVVLRWRQHEDGMLRLCWSERGGPAILGRPTRQGFGSRLLRTAITGQLDGTAELDWDEGGLRCTIAVPGTLVSLAAEEQAASPDAAPAPGEMPPAAPALQGVRVLVVEDEALIAEDTAQILAALGCTVLGPAATPEAALGLLGREARPDVALLDVNLAGRSSFSVAEKLASQGVPVVFMSGYSDLGDWRGKAAAVLCKPVTPAEIASALHRTVGRMLA